MALKTGFTQPRLFDYSGDITKEWYVGFRMTNPDTGIRKPFQFRDGINFLATKGERYIAAKRLCAAYHDALKDGWNPFNKPLDQYYEQILDDQVAEAKDPASLTLADYMKDPTLLPKMPFNMALEYAYQNKKDGLSKKTNSAYRTTRDFVQAAATKLQFDLLPVSEIRRGHIKLIIDQIGKDRVKAVGKFTGNAYNKYLENLRTLLNEIEQSDGIEYNPCSKIGSRTEIHTNKHRHATEAEERLIKSTLKQKYYTLYVYLAVEELCGLRPVEILGLRIEDIDWFNQSFNIHATEGRSKTKTARKAPMPNTLLPLLKTLGLDKYPPSFHIFSKKLAPGASRWDRDRVTDLWLKIKQELKIDVSLYSFKGLGGDKKRDAGIDKGAVSKQYGHTTTRMTDVYLEREDERLRRVIIEHTPSFDATE